MIHSTRITLLAGLRILAALLFVAAGINHFLRADFYRRIIPPFFPAPGALVAISGLAEFLGGIGLLVPRLRRMAGLGLIALLVAVFPANIYMAVAPDRVPTLGAPPWVLWLRLPLQLVLGAWVWWISRSSASLPAPERNHMIRS